MDAAHATVLFVDCGTMVGHQQRELELPQESVGFFGIVAHDEAIQLRIRASNHSNVDLRMIYRSQNGMWRIELTDDIPEIAAENLIPDGTRRSDHVAVFSKLDSQSDGIQLDFVPVESEERQTHIDTAQASGYHNRTKPGPDGRDYGWY